VHGMAVVPVWPVSCPCSNIIVDQEGLTPAVQSRDKTTEHSIGHTREDCSKEEGQSCRQTAVRGMQGRVHSVISETCALLGRWMQDAVCMQKEMKSCGTRCLHALASGWEALRAVCPCCCLLCVREQVGIWFVDRVQGRIWFCLHQERSRHSGSDAYVRGW
jgi:hypothetical protein